MQLAVYLQHFLSNPTVKTFNERILWNTLYIYIHVYISYICICLFESMRRKPNWFLFLLIINNSKNNWKKRQGIEIGIIFPLDLFSRWFIQETEKMTGLKTLHSLWIIIKRRRKRELINFIFLPKWYRCFFLWL